MTKKEFMKDIYDMTNGAVRFANEYLAPLELSLSVNWEYNFGNTWKDAIGIYENDSVCTGEMSIGMNINQLYKSVSRLIRRFPNTYPITIMKEAINTNVFHEMAHGLCNFFNDWLQHSDELDELYDKNQELFDSVLDNEEQSAEDFAWALYDGIEQNNDLGRLVQIYIRWKKRL